MQTNIVHAPRRNLCLRNLVLVRFIIGSRMLPHVLVAVAPTVTWAELGCPLHDASATRSGVAVSSHYIPFFFTHSYR